MGNSVPHLSVSSRQIQIAPGNVLLHVYGGDAQQAQSISKGDGGTSYHNLIRGRIIRIGPAFAQAMGHPSPSVPSLKPGDEVMVRARKGYPLDLVDGRFFVFNDWDVAVNLGMAAQTRIAIGTGSSSPLPNAPPPYEEKQPWN